MNQHGSNQKLLLRPFARENSPKDCRINALLSKGEAGFKVDFKLAAQLSDLIIPSFEPSKAQRKEKLWEHTCFEVFLGQMSSLNYWEINLSLSGDWNVYKFSGYREGIKEEIFFKTLPFSVQIVSERDLMLAVVIDLNLFPVFSDYIVGLSVVLEQKGGVKSYWAVSHPREVLDFHAREGWFEV